MYAMALKSVTDMRNNGHPLEMTEFPVPVPGEGEVLVKVSVCGVCHTELDEIEGRIPGLSLPLIPGHQIVGRVAERGKGVRKFNLGDRVGAGWIFSACGECSFCLEGRENLCEQFKATGKDVHGGYAEYTRVRADFAYAIPPALSDAEAAPLLCAGAIGYRSLRLAEADSCRTLGMTGFGASAHLMMKILRHRHPQTRIFVFARSEKERKFSEELGACWTGDTADKAPEKLDCIIDTTPAWKPVVGALGNLRKGGRLIINAIQKEERDIENLTGIKYADHLWLEKEIKTVANVTRKDIVELLAIAQEIPLKPEFQEFPLGDANRALVELKERRIRGAKVLRVAGL